MPAGQPAHPTTADRSAPRARATAAVAAAGSLAADLRRDDLAQRLAATAVRLEQPGVSVLVVGEFKQGKSTLVNELLGRAICPVDDDVATAALTHLRYSREPWGNAYLRSDDGESVVERAIDLADAPVYASELGNPRNEKQLIRVEFGLPAVILQGGMVLVDTPGVGGLDSSLGALTLAALAEADAVIFVTDASQGLSAPELDFLTRAHQLCPTVIPVVSKIDLYPEWRRIVELDEAHLLAAGVASPIVAISSHLHHRARELEERALMEESGFTRLLDRLRVDVLEPGESVAVRAALGTVHSTLDQLAAPLESELAILDDPARSGELIAELEAARARADELLGQAARWQLTLNDGIGDLNSDVDHDFRSRTRAMLSDAEAIIDDGDPYDFWAEFEADLHAQTTTAVIENFTLLNASVLELAAAVEQHFAAAEHDLTASFAIAAPIGTLEGLEVDGDLELTRTGRVSQGFTAIRGGYSGPLMMTMVGGLLAPVALIATPLGLVAGLFMGRKTMRDERERQLTARRQQAKAALRRYIDEVSFQVGKVSRDSLRDTQRRLRDTFTERAVELTRSTSEAVAAAQAAVQADRQTRTLRTEEISGSLRRLASIRASLAPVPVVSSA